ncbi:MAG: TetR/AcrR family transcriptional regulator [Candidatus Dadabacteria bacterium]|nr:MAG: TetR/AcrR family transcriptional regulator [Candidatus Dadabacteria bacterium]
MARPRKEESRDRPARIIDAAAKLFAERGFEATTVAAIAAACGIRAPSVLHHYESKENLFIEVLRQRVVERFLRDFRIEALDLNQPPAALIEQVLRTAMDIWREEPHLIGSAFAELIRPGGMGQDLLTDLLMPLLERFEQIAAAALPPQRRNVPIRELALMFVFSLAGRYGTLGREPNLWGPEQDVIDALRLIAQTVLPSPSE